VFLARVIPVVQLTLAAQHGCGRAGGGASAKEINKEYHVH